MSPLSVEVKAIVETARGKAWTSQLILNHINWKHRPIAHKPVKIRQINEALRTLVELGHISKQEQKDGRIRWNEYYPIIPEPLIEYRHKHRPYAFWFSIVLFPALFGFVSGVIT